MQRGWSSGIFHFIFPQGISLHIDSYLQKVGFCEACISIRSVDFSYANVVTTKQALWEEVSTLISREHRKLPKVPQLLLGQLVLDYTVLSYKCTVISSCSNCSSNVLKNLKA